MPSKDQLQKVPPGVVNPLTQVRKHLLLTHEELASRLNISKQALIRTEQGVFADPPPNLLNSLASFFQSLSSELGHVPAIVTELELYPPFTIFSLRYRHFQRAVREFNYGALLEPFVWPQTPTSHPLTEWRLLSGLSSQASLCKAFCVHPAIIQRFEVNPHLLSNVPNQLVDALLEAGYDRNTLSDLSTAFTRFRNYSILRNSPPRDTSDLNITSS